jgi:RPA family protein
MTNNFYNNPGFSGNRFGDKRLFGCKDSYEYSLFVDIYTGKFMIEHKEYKSDEVDVDTFVKLTIKYNNIEPNKPIYTFFSIMEKAERIATEIKKYVKMVERAAAGENIYSNNDPVDDPYGEKTAKKTVKTFTIDYTAWHKDKY